jgi:glycosyltransferase involved in cell wall biosynthesis
MTALLPTWSHCIPTLNRIDILEQAVRLSLAQTCPPIEIIIVDAGDDVEGRRARIGAVVAAHPGPKPALDYLASPVKSLTQQRNIAIDRAKGDILFLFDDDTLMYPDCAEAALRVFAADSSGQIAAAMAANTPEPPGQAAVTDDDRKVTGISGARRAELEDHWMMRLFWDRLFMMSATSHFIAYDDPSRSALRPGTVTVGPLQMLRVPLLSGYAMIVRADVARKELFDAALLSYCPAEDLDASYRFSRHGLNILIETAHVHHFEAAGGRIKRRQATTLSLMNLAAFIAKKSAQPGRDIPAYYLRYLRRLLAEFLKDLFSRRLRFPQFLGAVSAFGPSVAIFRHGRDGFDDWYRTRQMQVLNWQTLGKASTNGSIPHSPSKASKG